MKKLILFFPIFLIFVLALPVFASQNTNNGQQVKQQITASPSPTGSQVKNQNEVKTQNKGEDSQLQVNIKEQENLQNMSVVAQKVQELLQVRTIGGIGEQVRQVAQEQNQSQKQIQTELGKIESRSGVLKALIGPNYQALRNLQKQMEQNQLRIQLLEQLQNQLTNQGDIVMVQETTKALTDLNISLQNRINLEEQSKSLLGWLFKLFVK